MSEDTRVQSLLALGVRDGTIHWIDLRDGGSRVLRRGVGAFPDGIQVIGNTIYWTTMGAPRTRPDASATIEAGLDYSSPDGGVHSVDFDGSNPRTLNAPGTVVTGKQLAADGHGRLYFCDREGYRVSRIRTDGTDLQHLVRNDPAQGVLAECVGVAVDAERGKLYWTQKGPAKGGLGRIFRVDLELPADESPAARTSELLWDGLPEPIDLEIHGDWLYWTDRGAEPDGNTLNRAKLPAPGDHGLAPEILADGFDEAIGLAVDPVGALAYVSDLGGRVYSVDISADKCGDRTKQLVADIGTPISGIVGLARRP